MSDGQWAKGDIRNYGRRGVRTKSKSESEVVKDLQSQVEKLRFSVQGNTLLPNLSDRLLRNYNSYKLQIWCAYANDSVDGRLSLCSDDVQNYAN